MADENPMAHRADPPSDPNPDVEDQALVLNRLVVHWPTPLQDSDLQRELQAGGDEFQQRDRVERAVHHLWWAGLVMRCGPAVVPTRAALHYHLLIDKTSVSL